MTTQLLYYNYEKKQQKYKKQNVNVNVNVNANDNTYKLISNDVTNDVSYIRPPIPPSTPRTIKLPPIVVLSPEDQIAIDTAPKQIRIPRVFPQHNAEYITNQFNTQHIAKIEKVELITKLNYQEAIITIQKWEETAASAAICKKLITNARDNKLIHNRTNYWFIQPYILPSAVKPLTIQNPALIDQYGELLYKLSHLNMENLRLRAIMDQHDISYDEPMVIEELEDCNNYINYAKNKNQMLPQKTTEIDNEIKIKTNISYSQQTNFNAPTAPTAEYKQHISANTPISTSEFSEFSEYNDDEEDDIRVIV